MEKPFNYDVIVFKVELLTILREKKTKQTGGQVKAIRIFAL
jgi:hypothetical protein